MSLTRERAVEQLQSWTKTPSLRRHARAVEVVMQRAAEVYDADPAPWAITGLLHDADYEQWPEEHPRRIVDWLREQGEEEIAHAVAVHNTKWGIQPESEMDKALLACDELAGFVMACCLVRPEGIATLKPKSVKKKLKDKSFAAKVNREEIHHGVELLGVDLSEHIQMVIDALKPFGEELGISGTSGA